MLFVWLMHADCALAVNTTSLLLGHFVHLALVASSSHPIQFKSAWLRRGHFFQANVFIKQDFFEAQPFV